ncbi:Origin recognition complex subunit 2 [Babesia sp. Xinjiang]|uniref:Origin recognition complex subunit 2 n=1 Tax=Babesia sp. Xinjiang TaxID=462227 RepID=UPI000A25164B|nr:Origin recognition complex subunit 2 [Babesia sp. Xinjiang]ORM42037.1 Origin recognition complex subunit 2 [Babesia sp. Xinjiang]
MKCFYSTPMNGSKAARTSAPVAWEGVEVKLPPEVSTGISLDTRRRVPRCPNVHVVDYSPNERRRTGDSSQVMDDEALHKGMKQHMRWLLEHFNSGVVQLQNNYAAPRAKIISPLSYMLGLSSKYLHSARDQQVDMSIFRDAADPALPFAISKIFHRELSATNVDTPEKSPDEGADVFDVATLLRSVDKFGGVEVSDEDDASGDDSSSLDSDDTSDNGENAKTSTESAGNKNPEPLATGDMRTAGHDKLKQLRSRGNDSASLPNLEDTILHDYYAPKGVKRLDISGIESQLLSNKDVVSADAKGSKDCSRLEETLLSVLDKGDTLGFSRLISSLSVDKVKLRPQLVDDILVWKSWLINGQHLCFYGAGSKRQLIRSFMEVALRDGACLTIDGHRLKGTTCDNIWHLLRRRLFSRKQKVTLAESRKVWLNCALPLHLIQTVLACVSKLNKPFYLVVLGLEVMAISDALRTLRPLLRVGNVHLVGTMDHLRSSLIVPSLDPILRNYRLVCVNTGMDYRSELVSLWDRTPPRYVLREDNQRSAGELQAIIAALNVNHRQLFSLIAKIQLAECSSGKRFDGIEKYGLLRERRAITICNSESKLDALLTEFITHNLIEQSRGPGGKLYLMIPFPPYDTDPLIRRPSNAGDSSVGRAADCRSDGPRFDSGSPDIFT